MKVTSDHAYFRAARHRAARLFAYLWAAPTSAIGLLFLIPPLLRISRVHMRIVDGVLELHGGIVSLFLRHGTLLPGGAAAMTLGHVVLGANQLSLDETRDHERVHVRQVERWGPVFIPAYLVASLIAWMRGRDPYMDNPFEIEAFGRNV
ncbi:MAG: hypothetical protein H7Z14_17225 [Anaerolineae bacterium]|nr:hypothetical protein [Phycisphaerae bacterium]